MSKCLDLTGEKYGRLTVLYRSENKNNRVCWHCLCECGNECDVLAPYLRRGATNSCGCLRNELSQTRRTPDLTNKKFGRYMVISQAEDKIRNDGIHETRWNCLCDCGNIRNVRHSALILGRSTSCGCLRDEQSFNFHDLTGQKFGKLTVLERAENIGLRTMWKCICDCGNINIVGAANLVSGGTQSCGCTISRGEIEIQNVLYSQNIKYLLHHTFDTLLGIHGGKLSYDFFLPQYNVLIEYQGRQHYMEVDFGGRGDEYAHNQYLVQQEHDSRKLKFANDNNYKLIIIPYWIDNIKAFLQENLLENINK